MIDFSMTISCSICFEDVNSVRVDCSSGIVIVIVIVIFHVTCGYAAKTPRCRAYRSQCSEVMRLKPSLPFWASRSKKANANFSERGILTDC